MPLVKFYKKYEEPENFDIYINGEKVEVFGEYIDVENDFEIILRQTEIAKRSEKKNESIIPARAYYRGRGKLFGDSSFTITLAYKKDTPFFNLKCDNCSFKTEEYKTVMNAADFRRYKKSLFIDLIIESGIIVIVALADLFILKEAFDVLPTAAIALFLATGAETIYKIVKAKKMIMIEGNEK